MKFKERTEAPVKTNKYYCKPDPFIEAGYGMFQLGGNCTDYSWCRWRESQEDINASDKLPTCNAGGWLSKAKKRGFKTGNTAKLGAIAVYKKKNTTNNEGHVAFVEKIGKTITYSSSGYNKDKNKRYIWKTKKLKDGDNWSTSLIFQGYIYPDIDFVPNEWVEGIYLTLKQKYVRTTPEVSSSNKVKYNKLNSSLRIICNKSATGYARFKKGVRLYISDFKYDKKGNLWGKTDCYWICVKDDSGNQVKLV